MSIEITPFTERGNTAIAREDGASAIFRKLTPTESIDDKATWLQAAYTPENYPKWEVGTIELSEREMAAQIQEKDGWTLLKNSLEVEIHTIDFGEICSDDPDEEDDEE